MNVDKSYYVCYHLIIARKQMKQRRNKIIHHMHEDKKLEEERLIKRIQYEMERDAYKSSQQGLFEQEVRTVVQKASKAEDEAYSRLLVDIQILRDSTFSLIEKYLQMNECEIKDLPFESLEEVLNQCYRAINKLKLMCSSEQYVLRQTNPRHPSEYEKLFSMLIEKLDIRFALFAPKRCVSGKTIKLNRLPDNLKDKMFARLEEFGLTENEEYLQAHAITFKKQIKNKGIEL